MDYICVWKRISRINEIKWSQTIGRISRLERVECPIEEHPIYFAHFVYGKTPSKPWSRKWSIAFSQANDMCYGSRWGSTITKGV